MPGPTHGVADRLDPAGRLNRENTELKRLIRQILATRRLEAATIGSGGLTITALGGLFVEDDYQNLLLALGGLSIPLSGGGHQYGLLVYRQNADGTPGRLALSMYTGDGTPPQTVGLWDNSGNNLWSDDGQSNQGIARPYLSFPWAPAPTTQWPATTSGTFTNLWVTAPPKQQPTLYIAGAGATPAGVTGELRLWDANNNIQVGPTITIASQPTGLNWSIGPAPIAGNHMDTLQLELQGRITAGAGAISAVIYATYGRQS